MRIHSAAITKDAIHIIGIITLLCQDGIFPYEAVDNNELSSLAFSQALLHELSLYPSLWMHKTEGTDAEAVIAIFNFLEKHHKRMTAELR